MRAIWLFLAVVVLYFALQLTGWLPEVVAFLSALPWWVYFVLAGILFSGYKAFQGMLEDYRIDQEHIEQEGQVFLDRIEEERRKRKGASES